MKQQQEQHLDISAALAFMLIPLGGFATDIYLPSFPSMASDLGVGVGQIQLSLLLFMVSLGVCQFFAGAALDSFGRYRISSIRPMNYMLINSGILLKFCG